MLRLGLRNNFSDHVKVVSLGPIVAVLQEGFFVREVVSRGTVPFSGTTIDREARERDAQAVFLLFVLRF
jgi:hypothetical protein